MRTEITDAALLLWRKFGRQRLSGNRMSLVPTAKAKTALLFMSAPRSRHMKAGTEISQFLQWVVTSAVNLDDSVRTIAKSKRLAGHADESLRREITVGAGASRKIWMFYRLMTEMALCRAVDSYLTYLTELLSLIFRANPESLRSAEEVKLDFGVVPKTETNG